MARPPENKVAPIRPTTNIDVLESRICALADLMVQISNNFLKYEATLTEGMQKLMERVERLERVSKPHVAQDNG